MLIGQNCSPILEIIEPEVSPTVSRWFALYTKSRHEKLVNTELLKKRIETFLPQRTVSRQWYDRKKTIEEPLFKGYLFVKIPLDQRYTVLNTVGAVRLLGSSSGPWEIPEKQIYALRSFVEQRLPIDPFPYLREGSLVRVKSGPLKDVEGFIITKKKNTKLVISVDLLMRSVSVEVDPNLVELV